MITDLHARRTRASDGVVTYGIRTGIVVLVCLNLGVVSSSASARPALLENSAMGTVANPIGAIHVRRGDTVSSAIYEIKRLSGLTWEELSEVFGVTRRSVHMWANGQPVAKSREGRIFSTLAAVRAISVGSAKNTRSQLIMPRETGSYLDLLKKAKFGELPKKFGRIEGRVELSASAQAALMPPHPATILSSELAFVDSFATSSRRFKLKRT